VNDKWKSRIVPEKEAWVRFLAALIGLSLAFTAAVFSTVARISGNLIATAVLASLSLLLAGAVGLATVPYLARRVAFRRIREAFDYELTGEGVAYFAFTLVIGIAALNTGNNLLFIVVSAMLASVLMSGVVSGIMLRALEAEVVIPANVFAQTSAVARIKLSNRRRWIACFSVSVLQLKKPGRRIPGFRLSIRRSRQANPPPEQPILTAPVYFPYVPTRTSVTADVELHFERRGRYAQEGIGLATRFPFSLFVKIRPIHLASELIVYPPIESTDEMLQVLPIIRGELESFLRGQGSDLYAIRDHVAEDSARHVDWKATAKTGDLKVREFTREDERKLRIVFDNPAPGALDSAAYERMIATTASLAWHLATEETQLSFVAPGFEGGSDIYGFLRYLALVQPGSEISVIDGLLASDDYNLIVTARPRGTISTPLWANSYFIFVR
jgi:uncharacterized protein (DUF58 family)